MTKTNNWIQYDQEEDEKRARNILQIVEDYKNIIYIEPKIFSLRNC